MPAGRADGAAGYEEPGARNQTRLDRSLDAPVGAAGVAHCGEAAVDHAAHQLGRFGGQQGERDAPGPVAEPLVGAVVQALRDLGARVQTGVFGADMKVSLINDGPVTIIIDL